MASPAPVGSVAGKTWILLLWNVMVAFFVNAEFINLLVISRLLWPGESFHALEAGALITVRLWVDGFMALFWGRMTDKAKRPTRKTLFTINGVGCGMFILLNGFLPVGGGSGDYAWWILTRVCTGAFMSGGGPAMQSLSSDLLDASEKSRFFGLTSVCWQVTQIGSMVLSAFMFSIGLWRLFFIVSGVLFLVHAILLQVTFKEPQRAATNPSFKLLLASKDPNASYDFTLTRETVKSTIFAPTNMLVFFEGIFTSVLFGIIDLLTLPYIQSPPRNISPFSTSIFMLVFGVPGALFGSLFFARLSDKAGKKDIKNRVKLIVSSLLSSVLFIMIVFSLPLPALSIEQGANPATMFAYPVFIVFGVFMFLMRSTFSIFAINQPPIVQSINLPEAQGTIASWNQLLEIVSYGAGPVLAGLALGVMGNDYQLAIQVVALVAMPGIAMWLLSLRWIDKDVARIARIVDERIGSMGGAR